MKKILILLVVVLAMQACSTQPEEKHVAIEGVNLSLDPGDDFFRYANSIWYDTAQIPPSQAGVGAYMFMNYPQRIRLQGILDSVAQADSPKGSIGQKVGDFYASGMDTATVNQRGYAPIEPILSSIDGINSVPALMQFVAEQAKAYNNSIIGFNIGPDDKNSSMNIAHARQTGVGLPTRDYYFNTDPSTTQIQDAYKTYLATLFELTGSTTVEAEKHAALVYNIEKQIAASHRTRVELRDVKANYNKMAVANLDKQQPNIAWSTLLTNLGAETDSIDIGQPAYYEKLNQLLKSIPLADWKIYLKAKSISNYADILSKPFVDAEFELSKVLSGQSVQRTRGEVMASMVDNLLGEALGQLYVKKYFPESAKKRMLELVNNFQKAYAKRIDNLEWMSDSTKVQAKEKLAAMRKKIGYPDSWEDYSDVNIEEGKFFENVVSATKARYQDQLSKLGNKVDKTEWFTTPSTVTAYNNPSGNEIVFPAGILQPPYFDYEADDALNYGGIGMVIGHEITHTFDDQGAQFDKDGNVENWWTEEDFEKFRARTQQVIDLYSSFTVLDSVHVKGAMTVGENTADISGVAVAYDAFKMTKQGQDTAKIDGFTPDQRFFLSVARIWRVKMKDEYLRLWINNNSHAPPVWRVNGPLMNTDAFYSAFDIQPGDKMYLPKEDRITIW
ncbi:M13 family metallopeptidase [Roseivirga pacifica]|uniref:M13 family metallopeptidase n=1 Tax=Roseivirga pacifica TaxID=1267423 RepID=UPI00209545CE|nr:M13 family metallopeptidase [Roseivirga pacifica]MCO6360831.1 M13 family peptidase [Roseivirga pacifica]MCO6368720.1 M13 family peptidase [Roseivirga pacifica]MCO6372863.1 M13 family peptidase [Roseivirga pacifica]MCO6376922.1 M13 family peptidase [Roseivirga pacifica]MCO6377800.1 M13 family peptidase [Roseivirga pacifica]